MRRQKTSSTKSHRGLGAPLVRMPRLERALDHYSQLYPSLPGRLRQLLDGIDPALEDKVADLKSRLRRIGQARGRQLAAEFGLTPAQLSVVMHIAEGGTVAEYARMTKVSPATVRTHLKAIFAKTGARRQADLVRLISPI